MTTPRHNVAIPNDIWKNLSVFIVNKQGDFKKGDMSKWINIAINNLTSGYSAHARGTHDTNPYHIPKGRLKIKTLMLDICNEFLRSGIRATPLTPGNTILLKHLEKIIQDVTGWHNERTITKYMHELKNYGYIKDQGYCTFLILNTGTDLEEVERVMEQQKQDGKRQEQGQAQM